MAGDAQDGLWVGVLGPLEVTLDGAQVAIGAGKQRGVLAVLLAEAGRVVSTDRLIPQELEEG